MKKCCTCKIEKSLFDFCKSKARKDGLNPVCKDCSKVWRAANKEVLSKKKKEYYRKDLEGMRLKLRERYASDPSKYIEAQRKAYSTVEGRAKKILTKTKGRALKEGIKFDLELSDIVIPEYCPYLKIKLTHSLGKGQLQSNSSIDRIDPEKGYVKGNIEIISRLANSMKTNATKDQLIVCAVYFRAQFNWRNTLNNSSNSFDRYANLKRNFAPYHKTGGAGQIVNHDEGHKHLSDYIRSINRAQAFDDVAAEKKLVAESTPKLTFEEYWVIHSTDEYWSDEDIARTAWNAAQDNK